MIGAVQAEKPLREWKPDIVLANDPVQAAYLAKDLPVVWDLHDMPDPYSTWRHWLVGIIVRRVRAIVSTNMLKFKLLQEAYGALPSTIVLPNPVSFDVTTYRSISREEARAKVGMRPDERAVVYAGQLYDWKGVDTLISAAAHVPRDVRIHIVGGSGADLERCQAIADAQADTTACVVFHGQRPADEIPYWLRAADVVVVPNSGKFAISCRDTNPLKLYEAFAADAPVLASDLPAIREAAGDAGSVRFVAADDVSAWGRAICETFDATASNALRRSARDAVILGPGERARRLIAFFSTLLHD